MLDSGYEQIKAETIGICDKVAIKSELKTKVMSVEKSSGEDISSADQS